MFFFVKPWHNAHQKEKKH